MKTYKLVQAHQDNFAKTTRDTKKIEYIVIHFTAGFGDTSSGNCKYFKNNVTKSSAHYFVDSKEVLQSVPLDHAARHCGGKKLSGNGGSLHGICTNTNSIGVELCNDKKDPEYKPTEKTIENALELVRELMKKYSIPLKNVIRHYDVTGKCCPAYWVDTTEWKVCFWSKLVAEEKMAEPKIELFPTTTKNPLQLIGKMAGICWNSPVDDPEKNIARAKSCIQSGHGRVMEFVNVELVLSGWSSRMVRELYTHIGGSPTRLQESTRYVDCKKFGYYTPTMSDEARKVYDGAMEGIREAYGKLLELGVSKEDAANVLPLGMHTKVVMKCNLRMLENFMKQRLCSRAYVEIRRFAAQLKIELSYMDDEWKWISDVLLVPKCSKLGYCPEEKSCGRKPKK